MLGEFSYSNPTRLHFGKTALEALNLELPRFGSTVMLIYGGGSIKKNGIYDAVVALLKANGKTVVEDAGVMPNPTVAKLYEGCRIARDNHVDLLLAVGGGSVCDYAKAVAASVFCPEDPWEKYFLNNRPVDHPVLPIGCVLTMVGTGSEMNRTSVLTNTDTNMKIGHVYGDELFPQFAILNPEFTFSLPRYQMVAGFYDILCHLLEQYLCGEDDCASDYIMEGMMRSLLHSAAIASENPHDYEARSNIMWLATWALNTFVEKGKSTDWQTHMIGQAVAAYTDATHGMTLSAVSLAYLRHIFPCGLHRLKQYAIAVWNVSPDGKTDREIATEGLLRMETWMKELGLVMHLTDLGVTPELIDPIADATLFMNGGYRPLTRDDVVRILTESL